MKQKILRLLIVIIFLLLITITSFSGEGFIKEYNLYIMRSAVFQQNILTIESIKNNKIIGKITLDFNIGAIARMPHPWEQAHTVNFTGIYAPDSEFFTFTVELKLNKKVRYNFEGHFIYINEKGAKHYKAIVGKYFIDGKLIGGFFAKEKNEN